MLSTLHNIVASPSIDPTFATLKRSNIYSERVKIFDITLPKLPFPSTVRKLKSDDLMTSCRVVELGIFGGSLRSVFIDSCEIYLKFLSFLYYIFVNSMCKMYIAITPLRLIWYGSFPKNSSYRFLYSAGRVELQRYFLSTDHSFMVSPFQYLKTKD